MRPVVIVALVALLAAGLTALLAKSWLDKTSAIPQAEAPSVEVLVVARDVNAGVALQTDDLRYERWPAALGSAHLVQRNGTEDGRAAYVGQIARRFLAAGEPFTAEATAQRDNIGLLASLLPAGMRAVSVPISNPSAVSGFITPGDLVDVVVAADLARTLEGNHPAPTDKLLRYAAETVLRDIRVLAIDQQIVRNADGSAVQGKTATLAVTSKQAETLTVAGLLGSLQLVLRGKAADPVAPQRGFSGDVESSLALHSLIGGRPAAGGARTGRAQVEINRAGALSTEEFAR
ncbi:MAG TPA: Flp pilus assembly protein CpaB [Magnetospirillaceae bacterium]|nr:Flp pilus assembly protein CpaB [Magnetospirillaceae bacterium]